MNRKDFKGALRQRVEYYRGDMTYGELAEKADMSIVELFDVLEGKVKNPQLAKVRRLAKVLGVTMEQLGIQHGVQPDQNGTLGQRIEFHRKGMPVLELAATARISGSALNKWMTGNTHPCEVSIYKLSQALGVEVKDLIPPLEKGKRNGTLGQRIEYHREGIPRRTLAAQAGITEMTLNRWMKGKIRNPQPAKVRRLAEALGVTVAQLGASGDVEPNKNGSLVQRIEYYRDNRSIAALAAEAGFKEATLRTWLNGTCTPRPAKLSALAAVLGIPVTALTD
jgi:transcriptional regulator with XRE-family HTH domain